MQHEKVKHYKGHFFRYSDAIFVGKNLLIELIKLKLCMIYSINNIMLRITVTGLPLPRYQMTNDDHRDIIQGI